MDYNTLFFSNLEFFGSAFIAIFAITDPFAVVPVYLTLTETYKDCEKKLARRKATLISVVLLMTFAISGMTLFNLFGITLPAFQIAGGLLLLSLGIQQLGANRDRVKKEEEIEGLERDDISVFPLATPLLAGPGSISTVVLISSKAASWWQVAIILLAIVLTLFVSYLILKASPLLFKLLGTTGLNLLTRLMAIVLTAIAIQFLSLIHI